MKVFTKKRIWGVFLASVIWIFSVTGVQAAQFTKASLRYDRMKASTLSSLQVVIVPATVGTESKIRIVFGAATVGSGQSVTVTSLPSGATALPGTLTAVGAGTSITVSGLTDLTVGTTYAFNLSVGVSTPAAGGNLDRIESLDSGNAIIDSATVLSRTITNDQVVITANVPPTFTFSLSGNTDAFTTDLSSGAVSSTTGISVSVGTNAAKGWTGWVKSLNAGLNSVTTGENIATSGTVNGTPDTCSAGSDCYVLDVGVTSGTGTGSLSADAEYAGNGTTSGGTLSTSYQPFASRTGKTNGDTVWLKSHATMVATKAAGADYTDTWTIIGAGNF